MSDKYILNDDGTIRPATLYEWATWLQQHGVAGGKSTIALDFIGDVEISTIFIGLDRGLDRRSPLFDEGPPLVFETMLFRVGTRSELDSCAAATVEEALGNHEHFCELARSGVYNDPKGE